MNVTVEQFEELVDRHGPNIQQWDDEIARQQAKALLQSSDEARQICRRAQTVSDLLPKVLYVPPPRGLEQRILVAIRELKQIHRPWQRICANWILKPALAVVPVALGFFIGFSQSDSSTLIEDEITTAHFEDYTSILFLAND